MQASRNKDLMVLRPPVQVDVANGSPLDNLLLVQAGVLRVAVAPPHRRRSLPLYNATRNAAAAPAQSVGQTASERTCWQRHNPADAPLKLEKCS